MGIFILDSRVSGHGIGANLVKNVKSRLDPIIKFSGKPIYRYTVSTITKVIKAVVISPDKSMMVRPERVQAYETV